MTCICLTICVILHIIRIELSNLLKNKQMCFVNKKKNNKVILFFLDESNYKQASILERLQRV